MEKIGDGNLLLTDSYTGFSLPASHDKRMKFHFTANYKRLVTEVSSTPFSDCSPDSPGLL